MNIDLNGLRIAALLNRDSGKCDAAAEEVMELILASEDITPFAIRCVSGREVDATLGELGKTGIDVLVVLGGDGTLRSAAQMCSQNRIRFIALPGGTMNMLPRGLYGERSWQDALKETLSVPREAVIGGGEVDGMRFFCAGIFGTPAHWAEAREAIRGGRLIDAVGRASRAWRRSFARRVHYRFGPDGGGKAVAVTVLCPLISKTMPSDAPAFEAAALDLRDVGDAFNFALSGLLTDWRLDANVTTVAAREVTLDARRPIPALLDGEMVQLGRDAIIRFMPAAFRALVPAGSPVLTAHHEEAV